MTDARDETRPAPQRLASLLCVLVGGLAFCTGCIGTITLPEGLKEPVPPIYCQLHSAICLAVPDSSYEECSTILTDASGNPSFQFFYAWPGKLPMDEITGVPQTPYSYDPAEPMLYSPAPGEITAVDRMEFASGAFLCDEAVVEADFDPVAACASLCGTNRQAATTPEGRALEGYHPPLSEGGEPYCVAFPVDPFPGRANRCRVREVPSLMRSRSRRVATPVQTLNAEGGDEVAVRERSPDLFVRLTGMAAATNTFAVEGAASDIPIVDGIAALSLRDARCRRAGPCTGVLHELEVRYADFVYSADGTDITIEEPALYLPAPLPVTVVPLAGTGLYRLTLAAETELFVVAVVDGEPQSLPVMTPEASEMTYDPESGVLNANIAWSSEQEGTTISGTTFVTSSTVYNRPPDAVAGDDVELIVTDPASCTVPALVAADASDPDNDLLATVWTRNSEIFARSALLDTALSPGVEQLRLHAVDEHGSQAYDDLTITVRDGTLPEFVAPATTVTLRSCTPDAQPLAWPEPEAVNPCTAAPPTVEGTVISINGVSTERPVVGGIAQLPAGEHTVLWRATNAAGSVELIQHVSVIAEPTLIAMRRLQVDGAVTASDSVAGTVVNLGPATADAFTSLGGRAVTGDVYSLPEVRVHNTAQLLSNVYHGAGVRLQKQAQVGGDAIEVDSLPYAMPGWIAPSFHGTAAVEVLAGESVVLAPGGYASLWVRAGGHLVLEHGSYAFGELEVAAGAELVVPDATASVALFAQHVSDFAGRVTRPDGEPAPIFLGAMGPGTLTLSSGFNGLAIAPNARIVLGSDDGDGVHVGRFHAQDIQLQQGASIRHDGSFLCTPGLASEEAGQ